MATRIPLSDMVLDATTQYFAKTVFHTPPFTEAEKKQAAAELLADTVAPLEAANAVLPGGSRYRIPQDLSAYQIARLMLQCETVRLIHVNPNNPTDYILGVYQYDGEREGLYATDEISLRRVIAQYSCDVNKHMQQEIVRRLEEMAPPADRCTERNLIPVANGVFDYDTKTLLPFSPEKIFMAKAQIGYNPTAQNLVIHNDDDGTDWDVESWMSDLSDDPEIVELLWQVVGATLRPFVPWGKIAFFFSTQGNNGKGTLCSMMRNLLGPNACTALQLSDFSQNFRLSPLLRATAIINDENDVGELIDKANAIKSVATNDVLVIEEKFHNPVSFQYFGFMVQCVNEFPRTKDKSGSFYRRIVFIPFDKCFTGIERKYIKADYLKRQDVLEYVLFRVLNMDYDQLSEPEACSLALEEYKTYNDPIRDFLDDILPQATWDLLPFTFLYDLYIKWLKATAPQAKPVSRNRFISELPEKLAGQSEWVMPDRDKSGKTRQIKTGVRMNEPELLIDKYELENWYSKTYQGPDPKRRCKIQPSVLYRGIYRLVPGGPKVQDQDVLDPDDDTPDA